MPRLSANAVAAREKLAREMLTAGKSLSDVQKAMMEFVCNDKGLKGIKMTPARLEEIAKEVKEGNGGDRHSSTNSSRPSSVVHSASNGSAVFTETLEAEPVQSAPFVAEAHSSAKDGSISVRRCQLATKYQDTDPGTIQLTGEFIGEDAGLFCFRMEDGRVFKLRSDERVKEVVHASQPT